MSANKVKVGDGPSLIFVSINGPTLDAGSAKAMRAHVTRGNFARRRQRLVKEHIDQKHRVAFLERRLQYGAHDPAAVQSQPVDVQLPIFAHRSLDRQLNGKDSFFINYLTQAMEKLHLASDPSSPDIGLALRKSDWARFLPDPTMLEVSLSFARHVYAARVQGHTIKFGADADTLTAIRSVRERLNHDYSHPGDGLVASILTLTVLNQVLGNIPAWTIHISGLIQVITVRSRNLADPPTYWAHIIPRTALHGLLLFSRHDSTLLATIESTGIFNTLFSAPANDAAHLILASAEKVAALEDDKYVGDKQLSSSEHLRIRGIIHSLDTAIESNSAAYRGEVFLTAIALSMQIFLRIVLRHCTTDTEETVGNMAVQLMNILQQPTEQPCSSLALCCTLESRFWQTIMGAIAAPDTQTKSFYTSRLKGLAVALALTSWPDAEVVLQRFFWIPSIFSITGCQILSETMHWRQSGTDS